MPFWYWLEVIINWFVGSSIGGILKRTVSHPSKGVKSHWTHDSEIQGKSLNYRYEFGNIPEQEVFQLIYGNHTRCMYNVAKKKQEARQELWSVPSSRGREDKTSSATKVEKERTVRPEGS